MAASSPLDLGGRGPYGVPTAVQGLEDVLIHRGVLNGGGDGHLLPPSQRLQGPAGGLSGPRLWERLQLEKIRLKCFSK